MSERTDRATNAGLTLLQRTSRHTPLYMRRGYLCPHLSATCTVHASTERLTAEDLRTVNDPARTWLPCPDRCGPAPLVEAFYQGLRCATLHTMLTTYLGDYAPWHAERLVNLDPGSFYPLAHTTRTQPDPHDLGLASLAEDTLALLEQIVPEQVATAPATHLVAVQYAKDAAIDLCLSFGTPVMGADTSFTDRLWAVSAEHAALVATLPSADELTSTHVLDAPLTPAELDLLRQTWSARAPMGEQLAAVYAATT